MSVPVSGNACAPRTTPKAIVPGGQRTLARHSPDTPKQETPVSETAVGGTLSVDAPVVLGK